MPRRAVPTGTPEEWLRRAKSNLVRAKQVKPAGAYWEDLCFDTEQAAEKAVKAILTHEQRLAELVTNLYLAEGKNIPPLDDQHPFWIQNSSNYRPG